MVDFTIIRNYRLRVLLGRNLKRRFTPTSQSLLRESRSMVIGRAESKGKQHKHLTGLDSSSLIYTLGPSDLPRATLGLV